MSNKNHPVVLVTPQDPCANIFRAPYEQTALERAALAAEQLALITTDIPTAVTVVLGALAGLDTLRPAVAAALPTVPLKVFDKLETYTRAASYAHVLYLAASGPVDTLRTLMPEAVRHRETLRLAAVTLVDHGLLAPEALKGVRRTKSYRQVTFGLATLLSLFRNAWGTVAKRTAVDITYLDGTERLVNELLLGMAARTYRNSSSPASDQRRRAFTLFVNAWDEVRRAVTFLRWHQGDADRFAPSLYTQAAGSRSKEPTPASPAAQPAAPAAAKEPGVNDPNAKR